jgi:hypothetical protein
VHEWQVVYQSGGGSLWSGSVETYLERMGSVLEIYQFRDR